MWFLFALLTSFSNALYFICNQESRLSANIFMVYRGILIAAAVTPIALIFFHVFPWQFYVIALLQGFAISFYDSRMFAAFHKFGAENVNSVQPLTIAITFIAWLFISPRIIASYLETPLRSLFIISALCGIIYAVIKYRGSKIGLNCLKIMLPLLVVSAAIDTSNKIIMEYADGCLLKACIHRVAITGWIVGGINFWRALRQKIAISRIFNAANLRSASFVFLLVFSMITINFSLYYAVNPAYTSAIIYSSILWVMLINKIRMFCGRQIKYENVEKKWMLLLLFSAIVLILAA